MSIFLKYLLIFYLFLNHCSQIQLLFKIIVLQFYRNCILSLNIQLVDKNLYPLYTFVYLRIPLSLIYMFHQTIYIETIRTVLVLNLYTTTHIHLMYSLFSCYSLKHLCILLMMDHLNISLR